MVTRILDAWLILVATINHGTTTGRDKSMGLQYMCGQASHVHVQVQTRRLPRAQRSHPTVLWGRSSNYAVSWLSAISRYVHLSDRSRRVVSRDTCPTTLFRQLSSGQTLNGRP